MRLIIRATKIRSNVPEVQSEFNVTVEMRTTTSVTAEAVGPFPFHPHDFTALCDRNGIAQGEIEEVVYRRNSRPVYRRGTPDYGYPSVTSVAIPRK